MARILKTNFGFRIDIDAAVGSSAPNQRDDVGIVQYCLSILSGGLATPGGNSKTTFSVPGQSPIKVDGFHGNQTARYITAYQEKRRQLPGPSTGLLPNPTGAFYPLRRSGSWSFGVLEIDANAAVAGTLLDSVISNPGAPPWLKAAFTV